MNYRLRLLEATEQEVEEASDWYGSRSEPSRTAFLLEIEQALKHILRRPYTWSRYVGGTRRYVCKTFPYSLIYLVEGDAVVVVAVAHQSRRAGYWKNRLQ
jgi:plasmid stabilization system protein ParE